MDICLVIDSSPWIKGTNPWDASYDNWELELEFLSLFVESFPVGLDGTRVGAVLFSESASLVFPLDRHRSVAEVQDAIRSIQYVGDGSNLPAGLRAAGSRCFNPANGDRERAPNVAVVVSPGITCPFDRRRGAVEEAARLRDAGVSIRAVGVTDVVDKGLLRELSSFPRGEGLSYFPDPGLATLSNLVAAIKAEHCGIEQ